MTTNSAIITNSATVHNLVMTENQALYQNTDPARAMTDSPTLAVLPLNSSAKLDQEPNPFEQSFSTAAAAAEAVPTPSSSSLELSPPKDKGQPLADATGLTSNTAAAVANSGMTNRPLLPPVSAITSPASALMGTAVLPKDVVNHLSWDSLRTGPLSPSMLQGPADPSLTEKRNVPRAMMSAASYVAQASTVPQQLQNAAFTVDSTNAAGNANGIYNPKSDQLGAVSNASTANSPAHAGSTSAHGRRNENGQDANFIQMTYEQKESQAKAEDGNRKNTRRKATRQDIPEDSSEDKQKKKQRTKSGDTAETEEDEKRKNFLERNRIAALKCRQRKKQWLNDLQAKVEFLTNDNEKLRIQANALREEIVSLKTLLYAHKNCPISQNNGLNPATLQQMVVQPGPMVQPAQPMTNAVGVGPGQPMMPHQPQPPSRSSLSGPAPLSNIPTTTTTFGPATRQVQYEHPVAVSTAVPMNNSAAHNVRVNNVPIPGHGTTGSFPVAPSPPMRMQQEFNAYSGHPQ